MANSYTHSTLKRYTVSKARSRTNFSGTFERGAYLLRTNKRAASGFKTAERAFSSATFPYGASLGVAYDLTYITKTNRNPSVA